MPRQKRLITTTGASTPIVLDSFQNPFNVAVAVEFVSGSTANYKLQFTLSDLEDTSWTAAWFDDTVNIVAGTTTAAVGNIAFPVTAVRLNVASISGTTLRLVTLQGIGD